MNIIPLRWKFAAANSFVNVAEKYLPEWILGRLSQLGQAPQYGNQVALIDIQRAIQNARVGETYYLFALFRDMIENDPHLQAEIGKRLMAFVGQHESIEPYDKANQDDVQAAEMIEDMIAHCDNWRVGCLHLAGGHIWPIAGCEKIFAPVDGSEQHEYRHPVNYRLKKLHPIPYELYNYKIGFYNQNNIGSTPQTAVNPAPVLSNTGATPNIRGPEYPTALNVQGFKSLDPSALVWNPDDWNADLRFYNVLSNGLIDWSLSGAYKADPMRHVLHSANVATASMNPNYGGLMGSLIFPWFLSIQGRDWFSRAMERYASPFIVGKANTANKNVYDALAKSFEQSTKLNGIIVPTNCSIELKEVMVSGMADGYAKFIEMLNVSKTVAILGQSLSTSAKGGAGFGSGVADLQGEVRSDWCIYDQDSFGSMEEKQIFEQYLKINGCKGRVPKSRRGGLTIGNQALKAKTLVDLKSAGWIADETAGPDLSKQFGTKLRMMTPEEMNPVSKNGNDNSKNN